MHNTPVCHHKDGITSPRRAPMAIVAVEAWVLGEVLTL